MAAPRSVHFVAVHRILRYIRGTFSQAVLFFRHRLLYIFLCQWIDSAKQTLKLTLVTLHYVALIEPLTVFPTEALSFYSE
jgi:hypothetical protein